jgi:hypothetical protein
MEEVDHQHETDRFETDAFGDLLDFFTLTAFYGMIVRRTAKIVNKDGNAFDGCDCLLDYEGPL